VNNSLCFPALFRGVIDVAATAISDTMCIAAAEELARCAELTGLAENHILPTMDEWEIYPRIAAAVGGQAMVEGVARRELSASQRIELAAKLIGRAQKQTQVLMREGVIAPAPQMLVGV
jgi:malate dehydrogenase (oxaloacetate-decarboxylating)